MAIPKTIFQTFRTSKLPLLTKWHIYRMKKRNPDYDYQFYDDNRIATFLKEEYGEEVYAVYDQLFIGAAKADFFRYAILYKKGGVYLDIDSLFLTKLNQLISPTDSAILSLEKNGSFFIQFALIFEANHPILKRTLEIIIKNIKENLYPDNVHKMTGPTAFTAAIHEVIKEDPTVKYRQMNPDYDDYVKFSYPMSKTFLYGFSRKNHWKRLSKTHDVLKK
jgi:mannosyltransferase OCH1-like enzyme